MEALIATPASPLAILISKVLPYFVLGLVGWGLCLFAALFLYDVPVRGSLTVITVSSALYLLIGLGLGLFVSGVTRSQFLASQITILSGFLPAVILSGFIKTIDHRKRVPRKSHTSLDIMVSLIDRTDLYRTSAGNGVSLTRVSDPCVVILGREAGQYRVAVREIEHHIVPSSDIPEAFQTAVVILDESRI